METPPARIVLYDTRGAEHAPIDSVAVARSGAFSFAARNYAAGFYQLGVNDTDRVDIILDPREALVEMDLAGYPLQEHITISASDENRILWEYKWISRGTQQRIKDIRAQRAAASYSDRALLMRLDSAERAAQAGKEAQLDALLARRPHSYFTKVVQADRTLMGSIPEGWGAMPRAIDWDDQGLLRSAIYSKAVMAALQSVPQDEPGGFERACDSLMRWTAGDTACWRFTRSLLVRLFAQYGPDHVAQHMVDHYVVGSAARIPPEPELQEVLVDLLRVTVGAKAPDVALPDPVTGDTVLLSDAVARNAYTCLFFYSSTCDHCHAQMPGLRMLYAEQRTRGFGLLGIALDADLAEFTATLAEEQLTWPSYSDLSGWGSPAAKAFVVKSTPALFLLDREGIIRAKPADHADLQHHLRELLP